MDQAEDALRLFANALTGLLDKTNLFTRDEWAKVLGVTEATIQDWTEDKDLPRPDQLYVIVVTLQRSSDVPEEPLKIFDWVSKISSVQVSPLGKRMLPNIFTYMMRPAFSDLSGRLAKLSIEEQENLLVNLYPPPSYQ